MRALRFCILFFVFCIGALTHQQAGAQRWFDDFNDAIRDTNLWEEPEGSPSTDFQERNGRLEFEGGPSGHTQQLFKYDLSFSYDEPWRVQCQAMVESTPFTSLGQFGQIGLHRH